MQEEEDRGRKRSTTEEEEREGRKRRDDASSAETSSDTDQEELHQNIFSVFLDICHELLFGRQTGSVPDGRRNGTSGGCVANSLRLVNKRFPARNDPLC